MNEDATGYFIDSHDPESAFRAGFEAGMLFQAATEIGLRHSVGLDIDKAWQKYIGSDLDE